MGQSGKTSGAWAHALWIWSFLGILSLNPVSALAQQLYISRYVPGRVTQSDDPAHRVEIFNASELNTVDLGGYILMTRHYAVALPARTTILPQSSLVMGKKAELEPLDIAFTQIPGFGVRTSLADEQGDFIILFDKSGRLLDAFYYAPSKEVGFLPARGGLRLPGGERLRLQAPGESDERWGYIENIDDPAVAYLRIRGQWLSGSPTRNLHPATQFQLLQARYTAQGVQLSWTTRFEKDCFEHGVERSLDGARFEEIATVKAVGNSDVAENYLYTDRTVQTDTLYHYRIRNTDKFRQSLLSKEVRLRTDASSGQPTFDLIPSEVEGGPSVDIRFASQVDQMVRVQLLDEAFRELAMLYYGRVEAERQHLVTYNRPLAIGKYYIIVSTEQGRFYEPFLVK